MDLLTQALLGGVLAQSVADKEEKKPGTVAGVVAGLIADADILIRSSSDSLLNIEFHRHFSHSLLFIPAGAAIAALILWPFLRRYFSTWRLYILCLAGYCMSGVLDACTSYGTHLFWPFATERVALNIISIIDPVFTLLLLTTLLLGLRIKRRIVSCTGLCFCVAYLGLGFVQLQRAGGVAEDLLKIRGHSAEMQVVKPTLGNLVLWRSVYLYDQRIYVDAIRLGIFANNRIIEGDSVEKFMLQSHLPGLEVTSTLYKDIQRFERFSNGFIAFDPTQHNVLGDLRYSMLPMSTKPLWGIVIQPTQPQAHVEYQFFRDKSRSTRQRFLNLLLGRL